MKKLFLGIFPNTQKAETAIQDLLDEHAVELQEISAIVREFEDTDTSYLKNIDLLDDVVGSRIGMQSVSMPDGIDVYIGGPIASLLQLSGEEGSYNPEATVTGPLAGGFVNAMMDIEVGEEDAMYFKDALKEGKLLIGVTIDSNKNGIAKEVLEKHHVDHLIVIGD